MGSSDPATSRAIARAVKAGKMRKLAPRLYSSNVKDHPEEIIKRNIYQVLSGLFPNSLISHRSVFDNLATAANIFLTTTYARTISLPGVTIHCLKGHFAQSDDAAIMNISMSSLPRAFLENLQITRGARNSKVLPRIELEQRLDDYLKNKGEEGLNKLRDQARETAKSLEMDREFRELEKIIGALLGSRNANTLSTAVAKAASAGMSYDAKRVELFNLLWALLRTRTFPLHADTIKNQDAFDVRAFFDAYFSNFIEGTRFGVEEAQDIAFQKRIPKYRPEGKDILGTFDLLRNQTRIKKTPSTFDEFVTILQERHQAILVAHPEKGPGRFKWENNLAGTTTFVDKAQVVGTLAEGFKLYSSLERGLSRAIFMMFLIAEVHPFMDGNGRIARAMMNAELLAANECPIIIVNNYRDDYLGALRKLTRKSLPDAYVRMMVRAQIFTAQVDYSTFQIALDQLKAANAFADPGDGSLKFIETE